MTSLVEVKAGAVVKIVRIDSGRGLLSRLRNMGLWEGDTVKVIRNTTGQLIVGKGSLRLALGRGMSNKIMVEEQRG